MPLVAWTVLSYSLALIIALSVSPGARVVVAALTISAGVILWSTGRLTHALVCIAMLAAVLMAAAATIRDAECGHSLVAAHQWDVEFETAAEPGDVSHVTLTRGECSSPATLLIATGGAAAGAKAVIRGTATAESRGLFVEHVAIVLAGRGSVLLGLRAAAGRRIDRIFGADAPMARALIIADMSAIPAAERDRYATAGLVHMLSVSGLHVGIVALALELLAALLKLPVVPSRIATLVLLAVYVAAIGAPSPAVRSAVMLGAVLITRLLQRPTSPWAILALGAAAPLWAPKTALELGWQLSVAGTAALIAGSSLSRRIVPDTWGGWRRSLATGGVISVVATIVTAPLVAWAFGRISILGPVTNLLADPVMALLQPLLFLALATPLHAAASFFADAAHALLLAFDAIARGAAAVPFAAPHVLPTTVGAVASAAASVSLVVACVSRHPSRAILVGMCALTALIADPLFARTGDVPELHMIDVGQGDALALRTSKGRWIVLDAGRSWDGGDAGKSTVVPYLSRIGGSVALFVLSHPHADHVGGAASLFTLMHPDRFLDPGYVGTTPPYRAALAAARTERIPWQRVRPGDSLVIDDIVLTELAPDSIWAAGLHDANLASSVVMARIGRYRVLFTGDAERPEEDWLLSQDPDALRADVLKVGHHGSSTSSSTSFLDAVRPRIALVSVGAHNSYGHPDASIMSALRFSGAAVLRTDRLGTVVLRFLSGGIEVRAHEEHWLMPNQVAR